MASYPALEVYEPPRQDEAGGCRDALALTRAMLAVLMWPVLALFGLLGAVIVAFYLLSIHPALVLIPIALVVGAVYLFARWEQQHFRPPDL